MLKECYQPLFNGKWYAAMASVADKAAYSPWFILLVAALALTANVFAAELIVYTLYIAFAIVICLFCRDVFPIVPMVICSYIAPSIGNNPGRNPESIFYPQHGGLFLMSIAAVFVAVLIFRLWRDGNIGFRKMFHTKRSLLWGMLILGVAYMISGIGVDSYGTFALKNVFFGFLQFASVFLLYFVLTSSVKWEQVPRWYFPMVGIAAGFVLVFELLNVYITQDVLVNGVIERVRIYTGWGMYNNVGGMLIMMLPFPFYLATRRRWCWLGILIATVFLATVMMTSSRGSIITGSFVYLMGMAVAVIYAENKKRTFWCIAVALSVIMVVLGMFWEEIARLLQIILEKGLETSRKNIFAKGIEQFSEYPILGGGFYPLEFAPWDFSEVGEFSSFFPPRWHNTVIQLLACCGVVGVIAYIVHCGQVAKMLLKKTSLLKAVIALSILVLMVSSMLDCHFFNIGPVLFYSMALAVAEKMPQPFETEL